MNVAIPGSDAPGTPTLVRRGSVSRVFRTAPGLPLSVGLALALGVGLGIPVLAIVRKSLLRSAPYTDPLLREGESAIRWLSGWSDRHWTILHLQDEGMEALVWVVAALTLLLLCIALINILTLLLARGAARRQEMALRAVLGAVQTRLLRQLITEAAPLLLLSSAVGLLLGVGIARLLQRSWPNEMPPWGVSAVDGWVLALVPGLFAAVALLTWLAPIHVAWRRDLRRHITTGGRATAGRGEAFVRSTLAVFQLAASLVLLMSAGLLLRGFASPPHDPQRDGLDARDTMTVRLHLPASYPTGDSERAAFYENVLHEVKTLPGVVDTSVATIGAWVGLGTTDGVHALTGNPEAPGWVRPARYAAVSASYFDVLRVPVLRGREFTPSDGPGAENVVVVNETFVRNFRLAGDPLGKQLQLHGMSLGGTWYTIVGVVKDTRAQGIGMGAEPVPVLYLSALQHPPSTAALAVRTLGDPLRLAPAVLETIRAVEPEVVLTNVMTMETYLARLRAPLRWFAVLFGGLAITALLLAASGLYGLVSHTVVRRTREIGIRMALGARIRDVIRMILGQGLKLTGIGTVLGLIGAVGVARLLQLRFNGVELFDPLLYGGVAGALTAVSLLASYRPARRAASVDPQICLREE